MLRLLLAAAFIGLANIAAAQSFIFNQFFQPSVRLNMEYTPDMGNRF